MSSIRLIVFDFDGTLVDSQRAILEAMAAAFIQAGLKPPSDDAIRRVIGLRLEAALAALLPGLSGEAYHTLAEDYRHRAHQLRSDPAHHEPLFPGALDAIRALNHPQTLLGIATGKNRRGLNWSLDYHEIREHFIVLKTVDDGPSKPHPEILEQAMTEVGAEPDNTVMVGDTAFDMLMARNAGARALGVAWGYHPAEELWQAGAEEVLPNFPALLPALRQLDMIP